MARARRKESFGLRTIGPMNEKLNIEIARELLEELARWGVTEFAVCAGARNSPLVSVLAKCSNAKIYSFFEERSAAFFMLGRARALGSPAAVLTTSGTAAAELLPAMVEAHYSGVPLVAVTADRPSRMRGTGAPQTIEQTSLFKNFAELEFDIENSKPQISDWSLAAPLHINIRFDEPLLDKKIEEWALPTKSKSASPSASFSYLKIAQFLKRTKCPLVLVGGLTNEEEREATLKLLNSSGLPAYIEAQSGIREKYPLAIKSGDAFLSFVLKNKMVDSIVRIGSIPTARVWRDLENPQTKVPVLSLSHLQFSGLSESEHVAGEWWNWDLDCKLTDEQTASAKELLALDQKFASQLERSLEIKNSEPSWFKFLSEGIPADALLYLGNSLPIREWDLAANRKISRIALANRGANGIDGQISTFLGLCASDDVSEGWCIVGDLTAMYDLAAPWVMRVLGNKKIRIVVINNGGGMIFHRIFKDPLFENQHDVSFEHWAMMWKFDYLKLDSESTSSFKSLPDQVVIEIVPSAQATQDFYDRYDQMWPKVEKAK